MLLQGKKAVITGGSSGIGKAIASLFVQHGADVIIFGTNKEKAQKAQQEIALEKLDKEQHVSFLIVNVSQTKPVEDAMLLANETLGGIDILVNNAGITRDALLLKMKEEQWDEVLDVNLKSLYNTCKVAVKLMMKAKFGKIINISSVVGLTGNPGQVNYSASKSGIIGFTKSLAKEVGKRNILVNCIAPGYITTAMTEDLPKSVKEEMMKAIPLKRLGDTLDIAQGALFLASNLSDYVTGQVLVIDGGMVM